MLGMIVRIAPRRPDWRHVAIDVVIVILRLLVCGVAVVVLALASAVDFVAGKDNRACKGGINKRLYARTPRLTVGNKNAFDFWCAFCPLHFLHGFETSRAARLGVGSTAWVVVDVDFGGELGKVLGVRTSWMGAVRRPTEPKRTVRLVQKYLEHTVP